jgi:hypothetical protein
LSGCPKAVLLVRGDRVLDGHRAVVGHREGRNAVEQQRVAVGQLEARLQRGRQHALQRQGLHRAGRVGAHAHRDLGGEGEAHSHEGVGLSL